MPSMAANSRQHHFMKQRETTDNSFPVVAGRPRQCALHPDDIGATATRQKQGGEAGTKEE